MDSSHSFGWMPATWSPRSSADSDDEMEETESYLQVIDDDAHRFELVESPKPVQDTPMEDDSRSGDAFAASTTHIDNDYTTPRPHVLPDGPTSVGPSRPFNIFTSHNATTSSFGFDPAPVIPSGSLSSIDISLKNLDASTSSALFASPRMGNLRGDSPVSPHISLRYLSCSHAA